MYVLRYSTAAQYFQGQDGMTCLHLAAKCGSVDTVKYLVEMTDTDVNIKASCNTRIKLIVF